MKRRVMINPVLLVDDEKEIVDFLEHFLARFGIPTRKATSAQEALDIYQKEKISWVFLDIHLGEVDGFEVLKQLKKLNPEAKVIMLTGRIDKYAQQKAEKLGSLDYIKKPLDLSELKVKINQYMSPND